MAYHQKCYKISPPQVKITFYTVFYNYIFLHSHVKSYLFIYLFIIFLGLCKLYKYIYFYIYTECKSQTIYMHNTGNYQPIGPG
jgi:hypothetical protein